MLSLLLCLVATGVVLGQQPPAPHCCFSHKFTGSLFQLGAYQPAGDTQAHVHDSVVWLSYDWDAKMVATNSTTFNPTTGAWDNATVIEDFNTRTRYVMSNMSCTSEHIDHKQQLQSPCVPSNFTFLGHYKLGSQNATLKVNAYEAPHGHEHLTFRIHTTDADCTPVAQDFYGEDSKGRSVMTWMYADLHRGGHMQQAFMVPKRCHHGDPVVGKRDARIETLKNLIRPFTF